MYQLSILQSQWVVAALIGGVALVLLVLLAYLALWRGREPEAAWQSVESESTWRRTWNFLPWILIFMYAGIVVWGLGYMLMHALYPPNW